MQTTKIKLIKNTQRAHHISEYTSSSPFFILFYFTLPFVNLPRGMLRYFLYFTLRHVIIVKRYPSLLKPSFYVSLR